MQWLMQRGLLCWAVITLGSRRAGAAHGLPLHPWPVGAGVSSWRAQKATLEALRGRLLLRAGPPCEILGWTVAAWDRENRLVRPATSATLWNIPSPGFCSNCSSLGTPHYSSWLMPLLPILEMNLWTMVPPHPTAVHSTTVYWPIFQGQAKDKQD